MRTFLLAGAACLGWAIPALATDATPPATAPIYAQHLVDAAVAAHPDVVVMATHAVPAGGKDNVVVASNIGRIGKLADSDDMRVIDTGKPNLAVNKAGDRYEVELPLYDASPRLLGALGTVYNYKAGDDKAALRACARAVLADFEAQGTSDARLLGPADGAGAAAAAAKSPLTIIGHTDLPGYEGDFDHFAVDVPGNRLFLAAEDHGTLEVFDLAIGARLKTVKGPIETPHSILYMPDVHKLLVTDTGKGMSTYFNSDTYQPIGSLKLVQGADSTGYDAPANRLYIVTGGKDVPMDDSWLEAVDPKTGKHFDRLHFAANHVEAMAVEQQGPNIFINVTDKNTVVVVDKATMTVKATWPVTAAEQNCCFAFDEANHRLFMVTRKPGKILVFDSNSGATLATFGAPLRVDQIVWDEARHRAYAIGGEGWISIIQENDPDHFVELPRLLTAPGAKTGLLVPELNTLFVAVSPGDTKAMAQVLRISTGQ